MDVRGLSEGSVFGKGLQLTLVTMPGDGHWSGKPRRGRESPRIMSQKHNLRTEGQAWDFQEASTDPRMEGVARTESKFSLTLEFGMWW